MATAILTQSVSKISHADSIGQKPIKAHIKTSLKWHLVRTHVVKESIRGDKKKKIQVLQLQRVFGDFSSYETSPNDPQSLPRPLSQTDLSDSNSNESRLRVAYQGVPGAYSESAAAVVYPNCKPIPCEQFENTFDAVEQSVADRAVLPFENSLGGSIHRNYDLILRHKLHIVGELTFPVRHCLLANQGVKKEDLKRVLSHPQALAQCEHTLTKLGVAREAVDDTAGAAKFVAAHKLQDTGAVASSLAAEIYGLDILSRDIQDDSDNVTRFLILGREPIIPGVDKPFKTSIVFSLEEGPGQLVKALDLFAMRKINLTKEFSTFLRVLGSFPTDTSLLRTT